MEQPWYRRVRRWGQTNLTEDDPAKDNLEFWKGEWKRKHIQGIIVNCGGIVAYYPSRFGLQYRAETLGDRDTYKEWSDAAHEQGLAVIARMDINRATREFYDAHPDWFAVDENGAPYTSQGRYFSCVNSDYYKKYIPEVLTEIIEKYHLEGFTDNSWKGLGKDNICYCENCRNKFRARTGFELPKKADYDDPVYRAWIRFSYDCRTENWDLFNETTKKAGGEDCLWLGMLNANPMGGDNSFGDLKALLSRSGLVFSDHQSRDKLNGFEQNAENGNLLRLGSDEMNLVPESMANYVRGGHTFRLAANPKEETQMWMLSGLAGGISPWYHHIGSGLNDRRQYETPLPVYEFHVQNEAYLYDRKNLANIGLVWSQNNVDFYGRDQVRERVSLPYRGFAHALHEAGLPFLPVHIDDIEKYQDRIDTLILSDIEAVTDEEVRMILNFVKTGKNLVFSGKPCALDADGLERPVNPLFEALGLQATGRISGSIGDGSGNWEHPEAHTYLHFEEPLPGFENTDILPFGGCITEVTSSGTLKPLGGFVKPFPIYPPEFSWIREIDDAVHPFYYDTLENGARIVYFAADIDRCYGRDRLPDHGKLLSDAVLWTLGGKQLLTVEGDGYIDVNLYTQQYRTESADSGTLCKNRLILHLTNLSGCDDIYFNHRVIPVYGTQITIPTYVMDRAARLWQTDSEVCGDQAASCFETAHIRLLVSGLELNLQPACGSLTIPVEKICQHEVIVIEY